MQRSHLLLLAHYLLPVGTGGSLLLLQSRLGRPTSLPGALLLLSAIGAAYTVDRLLDPAALSGRPAWVRQTLWAVAVGCGLLFLAFCPHLSRPAVMATVALSALCLGYHWLKRLPLLKTPLIGLAWVWACITLPYPDSRVSPTFALSLFLLFAAGAVLCDLKDAEADRSHGTRTLPVLLGTRPACAIATGLAITGMVLPGYPKELIPTALLLALLAQFPKLLTKPAVGPMLVDAVYLLPGLITLWY